MLLRAALLHNKQSKLIYILFYRIVFTMSILSILVISTLFLSLVKLHSVFNLLAILSVSIRFEILYLLPYGIYKVY